MTDETQSQIDSLAQGDKELAQGIWATLTVAAEFGVDVLKTLQTLALPKDQLKQMYTDAARFPNIFLAAIILREIRQNRKK